MKTILKTALIVFFIVFTSDGFSQRKTKAVVMKKTPRTKVVYKTPYRKIKTIRTVPKPTIVIRHKGANIYFANNRYYRLNGGRYIPTIPSIGFRISTLPAGYRLVNFNRHRYYVFNGVFYVKKNDEYEVVNPEIGTIIYELPDDYEKVTVNGETLYEHNNILYEKVQVDGTRAYEVVGTIEN
ncbi:hypothetical protein FHR24_002370 [Wenyingzhuangia heitensis]|uniref:Orphan protein n=1 Tax=Wenyingzhuangia heitensis TaxID=1487859 RepID=A0ABX0UAQ2_9FLAO|nr:DUF6515 family protein [Wenyingzhuangia heitensis]NIJ45899.1 hypothetical protein [Wenyingzhuangia heitensis]